MFNNYYMNEYRMIDLGTTKNYPSPLLTTSRELLILDYFYNKKKSIVLLFLF